MNVTFEADMQQKCAKYTYKLIKKYEFIGQAPDSDKNFYKITLQKYWKFLFNCCNMIAEKYLHKQK